MNYSELVNFFEKLKTWKDIVDRQAPFKIAKIMKIGKIIFSQKNIELRKITEKYLKWIISALLLTPLLISGYRSVLARISAWFRIFFQPRLKGRSENGLEMETIPTVIDGHLIYIVVGGPDVFSSHFQ